MKLNKKSCERTVRNNTSRAGPERKQKYQMTN
jgi:hypothetical protein